RDVLDRRSSSESLHWWIRPVDAVTRRPVRNCTIDAKRARVLRLEGGALLRVQLGPTAGATRDVRLVAPGYLPETVRMPGSPSHVEEIVLTAAAESSVEVVVVDEAFRPTANAKVYSLDVDGNAVELGATARDGRLRLPVVDSDSLLFARYGGTASRLVRVASAGYAPLKLGLQPASLLSLDRPLMPEVESGLKLELVAVDASEPRQVLSIDEGGNAARPVVSGRYLVTASDSDGPRIIAAVGAEPAAPGYPAELEVERVVVDLAPKD